MARLNLSVNERFLRLGLCLSAVAAFDIKHRPGTDEENDIEGEFLQTGGAIANVAKSADTPSKEGAATSVSITPACTTFTVMFVDARSRVALFE